MQAAVLKSPLIHFYIRIVLCQKSVLLLFVVAVPVMLENSRLSGTVCLNNLPVW